MSTTDKCSICLRTIRSNCRAIKCSTCNNLFHCKCSKLSRSDFNYFIVRQDLWTCLHCKNNIFPFSYLCTEDLLNLTYNSNAKCLCSNLLDKLKLDNLPCFDIITSLSKGIPNLSNIDVDLQLPNQINFNYYSTHEFHNNPDILNSYTSKSFSVLHCNIRSLAANKDKLSILLEDLQCPFDIIGLSETRIKNNQDPVTNLNLPGYVFLSQPTLSSAGGVGLYVKEDLHTTVRHDLNISQEEFEALWVEIENSNQNVLCAVFYRHPNVSLDLFTNYLYATLEKIDHDKKLCILMGDFNINLFNYESHPQTEEFINSMSSNFFSPHILQPSRITDHSATLIDNIIFNSLSYNTMSGNILSDISDHLPNFLIINKFNSLPKNIKICKRDYSRLDESALIDEIKEIDWIETFPSCYDANIMFESFYNK